MRSATVVLPVPGLPVKLMCRLGACACNPRFMRSLSITSNAAMSRMRALIGVRPTRSRSSSSITAPAWLCASTSLTVRASVDGDAWAAAAPVGGSGTAAALPGIEYRGEPMSGLSNPTALAFGPVGGVAVHRVADRAAPRLLTYEPETRLADRAVDDEAHGDALHAARGVEGNQADVVLREALPAVPQFRQHPGGVLEIEHRHAEHFPVGIARVRIVGVLDAPGVTAVQAIFDLQRDLSVRQFRQEAELPLRDLPYGVGHHAACSP